jgi:hypothetical protein
VAPAPTSSGSNISLKPGREHNHLPITTTHHTIINGNMSDDDSRKASHEFFEGIDTSEAQQVALAAQYIPGTEEEKKLVWKIDKRIVVSWMAPD